MTEEQEELAYESQIKWIKTHIGKLESDRANYGWAVDEVTETIETKVYGHGVLITYVPTLTHTFLPR